jgi:3-deoxy-7-phosphoheptulonate synthase
MVAAPRRTAFMGMTKMGQAAIFETRGNADCHVILRGGKAPNYDAACRRGLWRAAQGAGLREQVMIDCSHANSASSTSARSPWRPMWPRRWPPASAASPA